METSLDFTDEFDSLRGMMKIDSDVVNVPRNVRSVTLANRSNTQVVVKRTQSTSPPSNTEGFRLDAEKDGIWYITLENVDMDTTYLKAVTADAVGEVDISVEI